MNRLFLAWQWLLDSGNAFWRSQTGIIVAGSLFTLALVVTLWLVLEARLRQRK